MFFFFFYLETLLQKPKIVFQLSVDDVRHRCAQSDGGSEDRSLVPVITYKEFSAQMGSATCSPDETHFFLGCTLFFSSCYCILCLLTLTAGACFTGLHRAAGVWQASRDNIGQHGIVKNEQHQLRLMRSCS